MKVVTFKTKVLILDMYRNDDWVSKRAAETYNVSTNSVRNYRKSFGVIVYGLIDRFNGDVTKVTEEEYNKVRYGLVSSGKMNEAPKEKEIPKPEPFNLVNEDFDKVIKDLRKEAKDNEDLIEGTYQEIIVDTKIIAADKLRKRIKSGSTKTISVKEITDALKLLHEIDSRPSDDDIKDPKTIDEFGMLLAKEYRIKQKRGDKEKPN